MIGQLGQVYGMQVVITESACKIKYKTVVYGIADQRRPNNKKMLYRKMVKKIIIPNALRVGNTLYCHPEWWKAFKKKMEMKP